MNSVSSQKRERREQTAIRDLVLRRAAWLAAQRSHAHNPESSKHNRAHQGWFTAPVPEARGHKGCLDRHVTEIKGISGDDIMGFSSGLTSVSSPSVLRADKQPICELLSISNWETRSQRAALTKHRHSRERLHHVH